MPKTPPNNVALDSDEETHKSSKQSLVSEKTQPTMRRKKKKSAKHKSPGKNLHVASASTASTSTSLSERMADFTEAVGAILDANQEARDKVRIFQFVNVEQWFAR